MALSDSDATSTCGGASKWPEDLTFTGTDAAECERFIGAVRRHAYLNGKQRDDEWITDLVATCLSGAALKWHVKLPGQIAWHWGNLQEAMIDRFAPTIEETTEGSTPSLGAPQITQPRAPSNTSALRAFVIQSPRFGVIQVQAAELTVPTYIHESVSSSGRLYLTQNINTALRARFFPSRKLHNIQIVQPRYATAPELDHLGVTRFANDDPSNISSDEPFYIVFTNRSQTSTSWKGTSGPTKAAVWTISDKNVVQASWDCIDLIPFVGIRPLETDRYGDPKSSDMIHPIIAMAVDETGFRAMYQGGTRTYSKAEMVFKPLDHLYDQVSSRF
ncbi:hypothetical protein FRB93_002065 [Tulasnella sp. JGI-2019a]|nr:hypothetical protein FRB93_002065 [Tulasnella sp. JGI-2019a]